MSLLCIYPFTNFDLHGVLTTMGNNEASVTMLLPSQCLQAWVYKMFAKKFSYEIESDGFH